MAAWELKCSKNDNVETMKKVSNYACMRAISNHDCMKQCIARFLDSDWLIIMSGLVESSFKMVLLLKIIHQSVLAGDPCLFT